MLSLEFSWGRWNGDDLRDLEEPTITLITRVSTLLNFDRLVSTSRLCAPSPAPSAVPESALSSASDLGDSTATARKPLTDRRWHETHLLRAIHTRHAALEAAHGVRPDDVLPLLDGATRALRAATIEALAAARARVGWVNSTRWHRASSATKTETDTDTRDALDAAGARLARALEEFKELRRHEVLAPFLPLLDAASASASAAPGTGVAGDTDTDSAPLLPLRSLFVSYVFVANVVSIAEGVQLFLDAVHTIDAKRPRARLWAPTRLRSVWKLVSARGDRGDGAFGEDTSVGVGDMRAGHGHEGEYRASFSFLFFSLSILDPVLIDWLIGWVGAGKDPDSCPPTNLMQRLMNAIHNGYLWTGTAEAVVSPFFLFLFKKKRILTGCECSSRSNTCLSRSRCGCLP
jgi:hypothetical protein